MKRARCTECGAVLRRLYYQTGSGRRFFKGCGWGCFECSPKNAIARREHAIASAAVPEPSPEPVPEPGPEPEPAPVLQRSLAAEAKALFRDYGVPPELLAELDAAADEIAAETRYRKAKK
tara:strand:+ start:523 stop:882 length:360 start_codon:yes stop_codon:yes gene_type:complete